MTACACRERHRPLQVPRGSNERPRQWVVLIRNRSRSAFNGYRVAWSDYSRVACRVCGAYWKTKAHYVLWLPSSDLWPGDPGFTIEPVEG